MELLELMCRELDAESVTRRDDVVAISSRGRTDAMYARSGRTHVFDTIDRRHQHRHDFCHGDRGDCVIDSRSLDQATRALHKEFETDNSQELSECARCNRTDS